MKVGTSAGGAKPKVIIAYKAGRWTSRHQLSLNSKTDEFTREDLLAVAQSVGLRDANHIIEEVRASVASWSDVAKGCGVRKEHIEAIAGTLLLDL